MPTEADFKTEVSVEPGEPPPMWVELEEYKSSCESLVAEPRLWSFIFRNVHLKTSVSLEPISCSPLVYGLKAHHWRSRWARSEEHSSPKLFIG